VPPCQGGRRGFESLLPLHGRAAKAAFRWSCVRCGGAPFSPSRVRGLRPRPFVTAGSTDGAVVFRDRGVTRALARIPSPPCWHRLRRRGGRARRFRRRGCAACGRGRARRRRERNVAVTEARIPSPPCWHRLRRRGGVGSVLAVEGARPAAAAVRYRGVDRRCSDVQGSTRDRGAGSNSFSPALARVTAARREGTMVSPSRVLGLRPRAGATAPGVEQPTESSPCDMLRQAYQEPASSSDPPARSSDHSRSGPISFVAPHNARIIATLSSS
jgi:hypothetical protein